MNVYEPGDEVLYQHGAAGIKLEVRVVPWRGLKFGRENRVPGVINKVNERPRGCAHLKEGEYFNFPSESLLPK